MFINRNTLVATQAIDTLKDMSSLLFEFNKLLKNEKTFTLQEISSSMKENFQENIIQVFFIFQTIYTKIITLLLKL